MQLVERAEVKLSDTWDLTAIYPSIDAWKADFVALENMAPQVAAFPGTLHQSAERLNEAVRLYLNMSRGLEKVYVYAHLKSDEDTANSTNLAYYEQSTNLYARLGSLWSFLTPELLTIPDAKLNEFLAHPALADVKRMITDILRYKPHTLSKDEENLLAMGTEVFGNADRIFSQLNNADLDFGSITVDGQERALTHGSYTVLLKHKDRAVRQQTFEKFYSVYDAHKNTIASALSGATKRDVYLSRARKFSSARSRALFGDNVSTDVYDNLISTVSDNLTPLHRYYELRKRLLGLPETRLFDTHVPLVPDMTVEHSYEEAAHLVVDSLHPLGKEYTDQLRAGLLEGKWVDRYENRGKRSGAYSSGSYDTPPYILMNYKHDNLHDVFTLAHEAGHSMHSLYSCKNQSYQDHGYTIFVAEVASTFNEQLLMKRLREIHRDNPAMMAYLVNQQIDDIKGTLYRQTMFAEFERRTHELAEANQPLTVDVFRSEYRTLLLKYFGPAVTISKAEELECLRIPHFYSAFYVYKYATGISAAIALAEQVTTGGDAARERYLSFLKGGCSKYPLELLRDAGVDMASPEPVKAALKLFDRLVTELERLLSKQ